MNLQLRTTFVDSLNISKLDSLIEPRDGFDLNFGCAFSEQSNDSFQVFFNLNIEICAADSAIHEPTHTLELKYTAIFDLDDEMTEEFRSGLFPKVNAPAIAYPFMRTFLSNTLLNAGFEPIMLPSVNFQAIANENLKANK
ncbi:protein-export chaperone SecB [Photobacterium leiognathi]|uniref:protein-export chaperone SecB n=1 Tax=Photobacterium leiognathi TaxID=553611 RepID=UPI0029811D76|nr:protein-export chaperone SecB [Photobacterium leiognathi]